MLEELELVVASGQYSVLTVWQYPVPYSLNRPVSYFQGKVDSFLKPKLIQKSSASCLFMDLPFLYYHQTWHLMPD